MAARDGKGWSRWLQFLGSRPGLESPALGVALGGGFARGIAHVGILRVFERERVPIRYISGVSAGAIVAAAFASGATTDEIESIAKSMKFSDVARWTISLMGLAASERMTDFLHRLLKVYRFEEMKIPLAVVASDLVSGTPVVFEGTGDVTLAVRASCSYPGLFLPIRDEDRWLVDGSVTMEIPAAPLRKLGASHILSVVLPMQGRDFDPTSMFSVVNRCFQILQHNAEHHWRRYSNIVIEPDVSGMGWDDFVDTRKLIEAGEKAALAVLPKIQAWLGLAPKAHASN